MLKPCVSGWVCGLAFLAIGSVRADELTNSIPSTAKVVFICDNLKTASNHANAFTSAIEVPLPRTAEDVVESMLAPGIADWSKPSAVAIMDFTQTAVVLCIPCRDVKGALEKLNARKKGPLYEVDLSGRSSFMVVKNNYLFLGDNEEQVKAFLDSQGGIGTLVGDRTASTLDKVDLFFAVNIKMCKPFIMEQMAMLEGFAANIPGGQEQMLQSQMKAYGNGVKALLDGADRLTGGLAITEKAVDLKIAADFVEGSEFRKAFNEQGRTAESLLEGVKAYDNAMLIGMYYKPFATSMTDFSIDMMRSSMPKATEAEIRELRDATNEIVKHVETFNMAMDSETNQLRMAGVMTGRDPAAMFDAIKKNQKAMSKAQSQFGDPKLEEKTIDGTPVLQMTMDFSKAPAEQQAVLKQVYPTGLKTEYARSEKGLLFGMNVEPNVLAYFKADKPKATSDAVVQQAIKDLPGPLLMVGLIDMLGLVNLGKQMNSLPLPEMPKKSVAPLSFAVKGQKGAFHFQFRVPSASIKQLTQIGRGG